MQLTQSPKFNRNYAAKIVEIKEFIKHPNPKCERLKCCNIDGYSIAVSIDTNSIRNLWRRLIFQSTYQIGKVLQLSGYAEERYYSCYKM